MAPVDHMALFGILPYFPPSLICISPPSGAHRFPLCGEGQEPSDSLDSARSLAFSHQIQRKNEEEQRRQVGNAGREAVQVIQFEEYE